ncbi:MAG: hypothetical protein J5770_04025 [Bacteroidaceae bacterium]|nr:hypothetical protein [Bacteroidaceae bacterium]
MEGLHFERVCSCRHITEQIRHSARRGGSVVGHFRAAGYERREFELAGGSRAGTQQLLQRIPYRRVAGLDINHRSRIPCSLYNGIERSVVLRLVSDGCQHRPTVEISLLFSVDIRLRLHYSRERQQHCDQKR